MSSITPRFPAISRRQALLLGALAVGSRTTLAAAAIPVQVWKDAGCGCCKDWIAHLQAQGFSVSVSDQGREAMRARLGMPEQYASCHTALVQGYVVEGHVPAADLRRLLRERPNALGLAVPGMPVGSPGMDGAAYGGRRDPYEVLLVRKDGSAHVFKSYS